MLNLTLITLFLGSMQITAYRSVPNQTDSSPYYTSIGERVHPHGVAVSRDLLKRFGGPIDYGDTLYIEGFGFKVVNDCMHERHRQAIDIWVVNKIEESKIKIQRKRVWIIHSYLKGESK